MKAPKKKHELRMVKNYGEIGAGRIVVFPAAKTERVPAMVPVDAGEEEIGTLIVRGKSLTDEGIMDGDHLVVTRKFTKKDITRDTICAVWIHSTGEYVAKKLEFGPGPNRVKLRSSGGGEKDIHCHVEDIEIQGVAYAILRFADERGRFGSRPDDDEIPI